MPDAPSPGGPGEALPPARRLDRPPGDRYLRAPEPVMERPRIGRALLLGGAAGLLTAAITAVFHAVLSLTAGHIAISVLGGWLIGVGIRTGAWSGRLHRPSPLPGRLAVALALATWVGGLALAWMLSLAILPGSTRPFLERLTATPFLDWLGPQLGPLDALRLAILVVAAWVSAQTARLEVPVEPAAG